MDIPFSRLQTYYLIGTLLESEKANTVLFNDGTYSVEKSISHLARSINNRIQFAEQICKIPGNILHAEASNLLKQTHRIWTRIEKNSLQRDAWQEKSTPEKVFIYASSLLFSPLLLAVDTFVFAYGCSKDPILKICNCLFALFALVPAVILSPLLVILMALGAISPTPILSHLIVPPGTTPKIELDPRNPITQEWINQGETEVSTPNSFD
jgi:hypothetical protein